MYVLLNFILLVITLYAFIKNLRYSPKKLKFFSTIIMSLIIIKSGTMFYILFNNSLIENRLVKFPIVMDYVYLIFLVLINIHICSNNRKIKFNYIYIPFVTVFLAVTYMLHVDFINIKILIAKDFLSFVWINNQLLLSCIYICLLFLFLVSIILIYNNKESNKKLIIILGLAVFTCILEFIFINIDIVEIYEPILGEIILMSLFLCSLNKFEYRKIQKYSI